MKWYNYNLIWIDIEKCHEIILGINTACIRFQFNNDNETIEYQNREERDAEFEKIKVLMGINKILHDQVKED